MGNKLLIQAIGWLIAVGVGVWLIFKYRDPLRTFFDEVGTELKKSAWPTKEELRESTIVVGLAILALGICVSIYDFVFLWVISRLTGHGS
jgi:preprotein translocase SecE subunit